MVDWMDWVEASLPQHHGMSLAQGFPSAADADAQKIRCRLHAHSHINNATNLHR